MNDRRAVLAGLLENETEILELSTALDEPVTRETDFKLAILALAQRARMWFRGLGPLSPRRFGPGDAASARPRPGTGARTGARQSRVRESARKHGRFRTP